MNDYYKVEEYFGKLIAAFYMDGKLTDIYIELNDNNIGFLDIEEQQKYFKLNEIDNLKPF